VSGWGFDVEPLYAVLLVFGWAFSVTIILLYAYIRVATRRGWVARDAHKVEEKYVADKGGIVLFLMPLIIAPLITIGGVDTHVCIVFILSTSIGALVGLIDDFRDLGLLKAGFVMAAGVPILLFGLYNPRPYIPFLGTTRMFIVYPLFVLILFSVFADACNMVDIYNGILVGQGLAVLLALFGFSIIYGAWESTFIIIVGIAYSLAFLVWNMYPASVFHGNVGAYGYGAMLSCIVILVAREIPGAEFVAVIALLPTIYNGFIYVFNTRFSPRASIEEDRRSNFFVDGYLVANRNPNAVVNLSRLLLLHGKLNEKQMIVLYYTMFIVSSVLAFITGIFLFYRII